ncbi:hypothetical protein AQUCO_01700218v1 [Aquilegia coerulea]|uniref:glutathione transferase n=1 Tax=Aquilegia coerulea TaxID=218851 RepID=A0A2G5DLT0_AQUCA|nr:hypothetical protein AQUCO_01700218v1 [Aquilegia coerulea]
MGLKVYGAAMSTCTARVLTALIEKEAEYELVPVNLAVGEHKQPAYLAKHPFGQIPVLEDDDLTLFGTDLLRIGNLKEAGLVGVWIEVESQQFNPAISALVYQLVIAPAFGRPVDQAIIDTNTEKLGKVLDVYEARLSSNKYLAGDFFSLADLNHLPYTYYLMKTGSASLINERPHVKAWWEDISSRPAFVKVSENMNLGG